MQVIFIRTKTSAFNTSKHIFTLFYSADIKQEPTEDEGVTENGQVKDEDDTKEAGELVSLRCIYQFILDPEMLKG